MTTNSWGRALVADEMVIPHNDDLLARSLLTGHVPGAAPPVPSFEELDLDTYPWKRRGLCAQTGAPDAFYTDDDGVYRNQELAEKVCAICPVRQECLDYALESKETYGIWGGMTPAQRMYLKPGSVVFPNPPPGPVLVERELRRVEVRRLRLVRPVTPPPAPEPEPTKYCRRCDQDKPLGAFASSEASRCEPCREADVAAMRRSVKRSHG